MTKKKKRKINFVNLGIVILTIFGFLFGGAYLYYSQAISPVSKNSNEVLFEIESGTTAKKILANLEKEKIIKDSTMAGLYLRFNKFDDLRAGKYTVDSSWTLKQIFETLSDPTAALTDDVRITFIEGDWVKHMAEKIGASTVVSSEELLSLWNDPVYVRSLMTKYPFITEEIFNKDIRYLLEGYLFPNTYDFFRETTPEAITEKLLNQTLKLYNKYESQIKKSKYSIHELFTLASIVQYESGSVTDMKLISGVFLNRLEIGMKLQSSVTICYALDLESGKDWRACETNPNYDSPYNTYKYAGLPPGPILNFGESALEAVLKPTESDYLFFMADVYHDGKVYYAKTLQEHEANVDKYLR